MEEFIARENIKRFEAQLADCENPVQRDTLSRLLAEARQRLFEAQDFKPRDPSGFG